MKQTEAEVPPLLRKGSVRARGFYLQANRLPLPKPRVRQRLLGPASKMAFQIPFIEHQLHARHYSRYGDIAVNKMKFLPL